MQNQITPSSPELIAADVALRRAAANVKKQAEKQGTPYVVYRESNTGKVLNNSTQNKK
jgi:hypothetical protein